ncbi:TatD DNase family protein [Anoxybacillus vitaminiphilus]|uniref:TatD DNase family protein n=1 Tax=Paranoxybacillus vitaminiphilus TaxID=581036 RepID=A0A327YJG4_9BACL|nr:TatD family hydrolase [Anoxybacillus vitaminiphilus]RAK18429.1 TatD DNase family protein [Anoxybacillus vitaminiphilus]
MIDAHIHLDQYPNVEAEMKKWEEAGIKGVVAVSTDLRSSYRTLELKLKFPHFVYAAIGFHPEQTLPNETDWNEWLHLVKTERHRLSAIGEVGLPYYTLKQSSFSLANYVEFLEKVTEAADTYDLPLVLHAVHEHAELALTILRKYNISSAHFHWLKAPLPVVEKIIQLGYYISVTPEVCYRQRDQLLLSHIPLEQLLLETDGPWPFTGPFANIKTSPLLLFESVKCVAKAYQKSVESVRKQVLTNTLKLYQ